MLPPMSFNGRQTYTASPINLTLPKKTAKPCGTPSMFTVPIKAQDDPRTSSPSLTRSTALCSAQIGA